MRYQVTEILIEFGYGNFFFFFFFFATRRDLSASLYFLADVFSQRHKPCYDSTKLTWHAAGAYQDVRLLRKKENTAYTLLNKNPSLSPTCRVAHLKV